MTKEEIFRYMAYSMANSRRFTAKYNGPEREFIPEKWKKIAISWSWWKDSCYTFCKAKELGLDIKYLFNLTNPEETMSTTWAYNLDFIKEQARQLGVPLITIPAKWDPEEIFNDFFDFLASEWITTIWAWHYIPNGQREFLQKIWYPKWFSLFEPNFWKDQKEQILEIINSGVVPRIVSVNTSELPVRFLWQKVDKDFISFLEKIPNFKDFCWENSSYQTIAVNCPYFNKEIIFQWHYAFQMSFFRIHYYF